MESEIISFPDFIDGLMYFLLLFGIVMTAIGFILTSTFKTVFNMSLLKGVGYLLFFVFVVFFNSQHNATIFGVPWVFHLPQNISLSNIFVAILALFEGIDHAIKFINDESVLKQDEVKYTKQMVVERLIEMDMSDIAIELEGWKNKVGKDTGWASWFKSKYPEKYKMIR
ncbi:hypothetical protein GCM10011351_12600 [Paraliobacillus quinghaiensis]|uniref:Uncharacterized protein n=1 Tax=Paraliobacillus quinghaiensis TaxID=470815 RepID=A0A917TMB5_9BACI|nr:hypothetical protein [Paraliobacillus quinghaiensis]GGM28172.1 hypothetical protein GCM10011351_12600 [Paraliobacillus quinghaiensis]